MQKVHWWGFSFRSTNQRQQANLLHQSISTLPNKSMKWYLCDTCREKFYCSDIVQQWSEGKIILITKQISTLFYYSKNTPPPHTHTQSYSISCAQIKGIFGKNDKSSFCSKSGPTCNDYLPFSCNWELKRLVLYPPGVKELMRSITGKQMSINYWWFQ